MENDINDIKKDAAYALDDFREVWNKDKLRLLDVGNDIQLLYDKITNSNGEEDRGRTNMKMLVGADLDSNDKKNVAVATVANATPFLVGPIVKGVTKGAKWVGSALKPVKRLKSIKLGKEVDKALKAVKSLEKSGADEASAAMVKAQHTLANAKANKAAFDKNVDLAKEVLDNAINTYSVKNPTAHKSADSTINSFIRDTSKKLGITEKETRRLLSSSDETADAFVEIVNKAMPQLDKKDLMISLQRMAYSEIDPSIIKPFLVNVNKAIKPVYKYGVKPGIPSAAKNAINTSGDILFGVDNSELKPGIYTPKEPTAGDKVFNFMQSLVGLDLDSPERFNKEDVQSALDILYENKLISKSAFNASPRALINLIERAYKEHPELIETLKGRM